MSSEVSMWKSSLRRIYGGPASVTTMKGEWKTGKTDCALFIVESLKELGLISEIGANIQCYKDKDCTIPSDESVRYIDNFAQFGAWLFSGRRKAFIYDEAITSTPSRRAMSELNTQWLKYVPELSKGRCHLIVVTQEESFTEKVFFHPTFHVASWEKIALPRQHPQFRKMVKLRGKEILHPIVFRSLPPTKIIFDQFRTAVWRMVPETAQNIGDDDIQVLFDYGNEISYDQLIEKYDFLHTRKDVSRRIQRGIRKLMKCLSAKTSGGYIEDRSATLLDEKKGN